MRWFILCAVGLAASAVSGPAAADGPLAEIRFDLDGDGRPDTIAVEAPAAVTLALAGGGRAFKPFALVSEPERATLSTGVHRGEPAIVAAVYDRAGTGEAVALVWRKGAAVELWRGPVGLRGRDRDHQLIVEASPHGLVRYQARADLVRCDGKPVWAFVEAFDAKSRSFRPAYNKARLDGAVTTLTASKESPFDAAPLRGVIFAAGLPSVQAGATNAGELVPSVELDDGDPSTAWREERGGDGRGETVTFHSQLGEATLVGVRVIPGDGSSEAAFAEHNRLRRFALVTPTGTHRIELATDPLRDGATATTPYWVALPQPVRAACVTIVLEEFYRGRGMAGGGNTAISDLALITEVELTGDGGAPALLARLRAGGGEADRAARLLQRLGATAVPALLAELTKPGADAAALWRLRLVLARIGEPVGLAAAAEAYGSAPTPRQRRQLAEALAAAGPAGLDTLAGLIAKEELSVEARADAVEALAAHEPPSGARLLHLVGSGPPALRRVLSLALLQLLSRNAAAAEAPLLAAIEAAATAGTVEREADLWRVLGALPAQPGLAASREALSARLATASNYELVYRLFQGAPRLGAQAPVDQLLRRLASYQAGVHAEALTVVLAMALGQIATPPAFAALRSLLASPHPGVRRAAAQALAEAPVAPPPAVDEPVATLLREDGWSVVRRAAASALGRACPRRPAIEALTLAIDKDENLDVQRESVSALATCRVPGIVALLVGLAERTDLVLPLRRHAISLLTKVGARGDAPVVLALFERLRARAWSSEEALSLAGAAAVVLGKLGDPRASAALISAAKESSFPSLQSAAVSALGELCPAEIDGLLERLKTSPERQVALAARGAADQCRRGDR